MDIRGAYYSTFLGGFFLIWFDNRKMMQSLQNEYRIIRVEVECLRNGTTILSDNFQSVEVISKTIHTDTNLLKKEFEILKG